MVGGKQNASSNRREIQGTARIPCDVEIEDRLPIVTDQEENRIGARRQLDHASIRRAVQKCDMLFTLTDQRRERTPNVTPDGNTGF